MEDRVIIADVVKMYNDYVALAEALGFKVVKSAVRRKALEGSEYKGDMKALFSEQYVEKHPQRSASASVYRKMKKLRDDLAQIIRHQLNGEMPAGVEPTAQNLTKVVSDIKPEKTAIIVEKISSTQHGKFLRATEVPAEELHRVMDEYAGNQTFARSKLINHFRQELKKRGIKMSSASIEERLRHNGSARTVPPAMIEIAHNLDDSFKTGLVPIASITEGKDPVEWLEEAREKLGFRSNNALHKAVAEATGINYETIHKALTNPKSGQRIRVEIRDYIYHWIQKGEHPPEAKAARQSTGGRKSRKSGTNRRGSSKTKNILRKLSETYTNRQQMLQEASAVTGLSVSALRSVWTDSVADLDEECISKLEELLERRKNRPKSASYLRDRQVKRRAAKIAEQVERAKEDLMADPENMYLLSKFRKLRLELIITIREGYIPEEWDIDTTEEFAEDHEYAEIF